MKVIIIEDEIPAAQKLSKYIGQYNKDIRIAGIAQSIESAVLLLQENLPQIDLIFMDIQLTDGLSFEIFEHIDIKKPVIFTTAFDEYAIDAFRVNSVDYLLKPISFTALSQALKKYENLHNPQSDNIHKALQTITQKSFKDRFLVKLGNRIHTIPTNEIRYFFAEGRTVYLITKDHKKYIIDFTLEQLADLINPKQFYRINRSFILSMKSIQEILIYSNSRLKVSTLPPCDRELIVSREKVQEFKVWLEG